MSTFKARTILIADDDPSHLLLTEAALAGAGYVVVTATDGAQAVEESSRPCAGELAGREREAAGRARAGEAGGRHRRHAARVAGRGRAVGHERTGVGHPVAVVVESIADFERARVNGRSGVVAVVGGAHEAGGWRQGPRPGGRNPEPGGRNPEPEM